MPTYDPTFRVARSTLSTGGTNSAHPANGGAVLNDLIIVTGRVGNAAQINPPDGTWTRVNGVVTEYQTFWKRATNAEPGSWTFTWDGSNQPYVFNDYCFYSAGGGTISIDQLISSGVTFAATRTSDAVTPTQNALVLIDYIEFVNSQVQGPAGPTPFQSPLSNGCWGGGVYVAAGSSSGTFLANDQFASNHVWGSGTFSLISSLVNPVTPPFVDDEAAFTPATNQKAFAPFVDDELALTPSIGIGAMHTTTSNIEVAMSELAGGNLRATTSNAELAIQAALSKTNLRITQDSVEIALQAAPPIGPVDFEIQTPGIIIDSAQQETGNRLLLGVNCNVSGIPQTLTPILLIDGVEYTLPKITSTSRVIIDMPIHGYHGRFWEGVRLVNPHLTGRVEVFLVEISTKQGVPSPRGG